jgi:hypothetical protein
VVLVVDPRKRALVEDALGPLARRLAYVDRDAYYTRPEDALAGYDAQVRRYLRDGAPRVRVFGELPLCRTQEDSDTWIRYEALLNPAFAHHPVTIVCGLDAREQPDSVLEGSWETHPRTLNGGWADNAHYHDPGATVRARTPKPDDVSGLRAVAADAGARGLRARLHAEMTAPASRTRRRRACSSPGARCWRTRTATAAACGRCGRGGSATASSARSPTTGRASTTRWRGIFRPIPGTARAPASGSRARRPGASR